jgi:hypothetical protein
MGWFREVNAMHKAIHSSDVAKIFTTYNNPLLPTQLHIIEHLRLDFRKQGTVRYCSMECTKNAILIGFCGLNVFYSVLVVPFHPSLLLVVQALHLLRLHVMADP